MYSFHWDISFVSNTIAPFPLARLTGPILIRPTHNVNNMQIEKRIHDPDGLTSKGKLDEPQVKSFEEELMKECKEFRWDGITWPALVREPQNALAFNEY